MLALAMSAWLMACQSILPPAFVPRPPAIPKVGIPRGEVPTDVTPIPSISPKGAR